MLRLSTFSMDTLLIWVLSENPFKVKVFTSTFKFVSNSTLNFSDFSIILKKHW